MTKVYNDLWADIDADFCFKHNSTRDFIREVARSFQSNFYNEYTPHDRYDWSGAVNTLGNLGCWLEDNDLDTTPETYLQMVGYGHFKEAYQLGCHYVLKLCTRRNPTLEEMQLLGKAESENVADYFVPTLFFTLPVHKEPAILEPDDDEDVEYFPELHCWDYRSGSEPDNILTSLEIQPVVDTYRTDEDEDYTPFNCKDKFSPLFAKYPILNADNTWGLNGADQQFLEDFAAYYGPEELTALSEFCLTHRVSDLHNGNTGTLALYPGEQPRPIILDWLSR